MDSQVWLITGSSRGLGRAFTEAALSAGHKVVAGARNPAQLADLKQNFGDALLPVELDVTNEDQAGAAVQAAIKTFDRLDVLVNNAGYGNLAPVEDTPLSEYREHMETNFFGLVILTKAVIPYFRERGSGRIFQVTSIGGRFAGAGRSAYCSAKFAVEGFSESLWRELSPLGVRITIVEPGGFRTDFAGSSTQLREGNPAYDGTVGNSARFQRKFDGNQPGDPAKAAAALLKLAAMPDPPLRILLGRDAFERTERGDAEQSASDQKWKDLSLSTDF